MPKTIKSAMESNDERVCRWRTEYEDAKEQLRAYGHIVDAKPLRESAAISARQMRSAMRHVETMRAV